MEQSNLELDKMIEGMLARDAERLPAFDRIPNAHLLSQLASSPVIKGGFGFVGMKLAFLTASIAAVATVFYFVSRPGPQDTIPTHATEPSIKSGETIINQSAAPPTHSSTEQPAKIENHTSEASSSALKHIGSPNPPLRLDEGDGKNPPIITDKHLQPPLR